MIRIDVAGIDDDIRRLTDEIQSVVRFVARDTATEITQLSPVDTGFFVSNWKVSFGAVDTSVTGTRPDPTANIGDSGGSGRGRRRSLPNANLFGAQSWTVRSGDIYFANSVDYASELDRGRSDQAKQGVTGPVATIINARHRQFA